MTLIEFRWINRRDPIPEGWRASENAAHCIHHHYGKLLIFREVTE